MKHPILTCRRSLIAIFSISCLTALGWNNPAAIPSIAQAVALIAVGLAGSNAYQGSIEAKVKAGIDNGKP